MSRPPSASGRISPPKRGLESILYPNGTAGTDEGDAMCSQSLIHDYAVELAARLIAIIAPCLRAGEMQDAFDEFYVACEASLVKACAALMRLHAVPSPN